MRALLPGARVSFDSPLDFGTVVHGDSIARTLVVSNTGTLSGRVAFGPLAANSKFTIFPAEAEVAFHLWVAAFVEIRLAGAGLSAGGVQTLEFVDRATLQRYCDRMEDHIASWDSLTGGFKEVWRKPPVALGA